MPMIGSPAGAGDAASRKVPSRPEGRSGGAITSGTKCFPGMRRSIWEMARQWFKIAAHKF
jgi:hypothetical protein